MAEALELDLVEISPNADPPVCKIIDYQKFIYQQKKKAKEMKANNLVRSDFVRGVKCALRQRLTTFLLTSALVG